MSTSILATIRQVLEPVDGLALLPGIEEIVKPAIGITAEWQAQEKPALGGSRLGGLPDMPPGTPWPTFQDIPMMFVAQLNCAELQGHGADDLLPVQGLLLFFRSNQWAFSDEEEGCARVLHVEDPSTVETTVAPQVEYDDEFDPAWVANP